MDNVKRGRTERFLGAIKRTLSRSRSPAPPSAAAGFVATTRPDVNPSDPATVPPSGQYQSLLSTANTKSGVDKGLSILIEVVSAVKEGADAFPPLKSAVGGFLVILERINEVRSIPAEVKGAVETFERLLAIIKAHKTAPTATVSNKSWLDERISSICAVIDAQTKRLETLLDRNLVRRIIGSSDDTELVADVLQTIQNLQGLVTLDTVMRTNVVVENMQQIVNENAEADLLARLSTIPNKTGCLLGTRVHILRDLVVWAEDPHSAHVYWLNGMAGTGKTAIALSFIRVLLEKHILGGWFLCSREGGQAERNVKTILPRLSDSLGTVFPAYRNARTSAFGDKPPLVHVLTLEDQFDTLLGDPLDQAYHAAPSPTFVFVVDALDECDDRDATAQLLRAVLKHAPNSRVKFFVTSRPERQIRDALFSRYPTILRLHDVNQAIVQDDIARYLRHELTVLARDQRLCSMDESWPPEADISALTKSSGMFFIYASTVVKYITEGDPESRLEQLTSRNSDLVRAKEPVYAIYNHILAGVFGKFEQNEAEITQRCICAIVCARDVLTIDDLGQLLRLPPRRALFALSGLHSLLYIPDNNHSTITTFHASFPDYLQDTRQSGKAWFIDPQEANLNLAYGCFNIMSMKLHFNIAGASSSCLLNEEQQLATISTEVSYACRYWQDHVVASSQPADLFTTMESCLRSKFLYWVEVLSTLGLVNVGPAKLMKILVYTKLRDQPSDFTTFLRDARTFLTDFTEPIMKSVAHIYISALPFTPPTSQISQAYQELFPNTVACDPPLLLRRDPCLVVIPCASEVYCVQSSPDGTKVAAGLNNGSIHLWDADSGEEVSNPFRGHSRSVESISFAPDGKMLASGSEDETVRLWDIETGDEVRCLRGHTERFSAVVFAPNGKSIVSASSDETVRLWDTRSGVEIRSLRGHKGEVLCAAFSPDGHRLVTGGEDHTVRLWNVATGAQLVSLQGHPYRVDCVAFAPDGQRITSSSYDTMIIWDGGTGNVVSGPRAYTSKVNAIAFSPDGGRIFSAHDDNTVCCRSVESGKEISDPFRGHTQDVLSVAVSPDGRRAVSGSLDRSVRIWDIETPNDLANTSRDDKVHQILSAAFSPDGRRIVSVGRDCAVRVWDTEGAREVAKLQGGHTNEISRAAFSPNGNIVGYGSVNDDCHMIRIWDIESAVQLLEPLQGHERLVSCITFSPDGQRVVSGSQDCTLRIWDVENGNEVKTLRGHTRGILSIAISLDSTRIASGSVDRTVRIWDFVSGEMLRTLKGHIGSVQSVAFSPNKGAVVSGSGRTIRVWNAESGEALRTVKENEGYGDVDSVLFLSDGKRVVSAISGDCQIRVWDVGNGKTLRILHGHTSDILSLAVSSDRRRITSVSQDRTIRMWDVEDDGSVTAERTLLARHPLPVTLPMRPPNHSDCLLRNALWDKEDTGYSLRPTSWIIGPDNRLHIWVPLHLRDRIVNWPGCRAVFGREALYLDFSRFKYGTEWAQCASQSAL